MYNLLMIERPYEKLVVWKEADILCLFTYDVTRHFPQDERFCLVQQMRKSSYSVPMNIALHLLIPLVPLNPPYANLLLHRA